MRPIDSIDVRCRLLVAAALLGAAPAVLATAPPPGPAGAPGAARPGDGEEDEEFRRLSLERNVRENCLICHTDGLIRTQRLTAQQWKAEVDKMVGWGAPLPAEMRQPVADYLASQYSSESAPVPLVARSLRDLTTPPAGPGYDHEGDATRGQAGYVKNCANCHGADALGAELGPNLVEKPVLLSGPGYAEVVRKGRNRMPGFAGVLDPAAEADILAWLKTRRVQPPRGEGR